VSRLKEEEVTEEQEARLLQNQKLIMQALQTLLAAAGKDFMRNQLEIRIKDIEAFLAAP
jgi:hypothetical protein